MTALKILARVLTARVGPHIELALATEDGETVKVVATPDQIDRLIDELEDMLHAPEAPDDGEPPEAA